MAFEYEEGARDSLEFESPRSKGGTPSPSGGRRGRRHLPPDQSSPLHTAGLRAALRRGAMSRRLRIGVSARIQYGDASKHGYLKKNIYYLEQSFARWLQSSGVLVYLVADVVDRGTNSLSLADYAAELDGLVLQGGTDISPRMYGEEPLRPEWAGDPERDRYEIELLERFLESGKPVLGICRGQQLINVALGGTLYQDTATQKPGAHVHQDTAVYDEKFH